MKFSTIDCSVFFRKELYCIKNRLINNHSKNCFNIVRTFLAVPPTISLLLPWFVPYLCAFKVLQCNEFVNKFIDN